jgi:hypothetical protein
MSSSGYFPHPCGCCKVRPLPGRSKDHPNGDLLCDICAVPNKADKKLAREVNERIAKRKGAA